MPYIYQKQSRRHFIKVMAGSAGAIATMGVFSSFIKDSGTGLRVALFSDTHIPLDVSETYRGFSMVDNLKTVVKEVSNSNVHSAIITGDLARLEGKPGDYAELKTLLTPLAGEIPVAMTLGNHDRRDHFLGVFPGHPGERQKIKNKYVLVLEHPAVRFILMDSLVFTNQSPPLGLLGKAQREWLAGYLKNHQDKAVILFFHHTLGDNDGELADVDRLFRIISPRKQVKAVVFGHSHVYRYDVRDDIHLINLPATGYNFSDQDPVGWVESNITADGGSFILHAVGGNLGENGRKKECVWRK